ncbi:hypothetical protein AMS68_000434 [Peltaster fructicola]|uniref:Mediator of RNA polymerase II transcription subunit 17 n=1 Tax=Peltaster fructicola TaxID=286661 RepID=A0A6H0XJK8_9PEZI|nr:hypothetical protein AMS68_000434 [Peltaster fructicola]
MSGTLTLRPWRLEHDEQPPIIDMLDRVNRERGHFRDVLDSSLQEEIATTGALQLSDSEDEQEEIEAPATDGGLIYPSSREDLYRAKFDMLQKVSLAHNEVMMALDFISLLESKDSPAGKQTMSQFLRENVSAGTLGTDIWQRMPKDTAREAQDASLAYNVRMEALQKSADSILGAAKALEKSVKKETRYWNEILSVTEAGWNVCRLPGQRHKLGVRFGLSESSPEFSRGGIAALTADEDGAVSLDRGVEVRSRSVRVTIRQGREIIGCSKPVSIAGDGDAALEASIKHARDALFDEELFRELEREGRSLLALGVRQKSNTIAFPLLDGDSLLTLQFELLSRHEAAIETYAGSTSMSTLAQGTLCAAKLLLCQAHREQLERRSAIPAPISQARTERPLLRILRPLLALTQHRHSIQVLNDRFKILERVLQQAGVETKLQLADLRTTLSDMMDSATTLIDSLVAERSVEVVIELCPPGVLQTRRVAVRITSSVAPECETSFFLVATNVRDLHAGSIALAMIELDRVLANQLAKALAESSEQPWYVDDVDADLSREGLGITGVKDVQVVINGQTNVLDFTSSSFSRRWTLTEESETSIWQVWKELV